MAEGDIETIRRHGKWVNVVHGSYRTQDEAAEAGRDIARTLGVEWLLRGRGGRWRLRNSYGRDPSDTPG